MAPARTKQINVYGKRPRRIIEVPQMEESTYDGVSFAKPDRMSLIHRMKKRENNGTGAVAKPKPISPPRAVSLAKQRVMSKGSPERKDTKRGTRVLEILTQETTKLQTRRVEEDLANKRGVLETPTRKPLSTIPTNAINSPAPSGLKVATTKMHKRAVASPKGLVTAKALSTVQVDIEILDAKGRTVKQEQRVTRTDIIINKSANGVRAAPVTTNKQQRPSPRPTLTPVEVISVGSSIDEDDTYEPGHESQLAVVSHRSSKTSDSQYAGAKPRPPRKLKRTATQVVTSDDSEDQGGDEYLPPPHSPPAKPSRKSLASAQKPPAAISNTTTSIPRIPPPSGLKMEVVIPPAPYELPPKPTKAAIPAFKPQPPEKFKPIPDTDIRPPKFHKAKPSLPVASTTAAGSSQVQLRYPAYNPIPSPPLKSRTLTPIRNGKTNTNRFSFARAPASPPSPTTPTDSDFDLSLEFSQLDIGLAPEELEALRQGERQAEYPEYLRPLLEECNQEDCGAYEFSAFIKTFPFDPILQDAIRLAEKRREEFCFRKIGEASYSEVFGIGDVVLKVIPLRDESRWRTSQEDEEEEDGPAPTDAKDVRKEIIVTRAMGEVHDRFVKLLKTYVVRGKYPEVFLNLWDEYHERKGSESIRPDTFTASQVYAIIVLPNGGPDLEAYTFANPSKTGWRQGCSLFWQVAKALAHAEQLVSFEHRDLHWGQILVKDLPSTSKPVPLRPLTNGLNRSQTIPSTLQRMYMDSLVHGVEATIIDLGLSRMDAGDGDSGERVHWTPFDEEVFMGEGDYQFEVYRHMREHTAGNWEAFHPLTNVMWLHYLATKLLRHKNLKPPSTTRKPHATAAAAAADQQAFPHSSVPSKRLDPATQFTEKDCYDALVDVVEWLGRCIAHLSLAAAGAKTKAKGRPRKTAAVIKPIGGGADACACAGEVVGYGVKRGWIRAVS